MSDTFPQIMAPSTSVSVYTVMYVHGKGCSIRGVTVPGADVDAFMQAGEYERTGGPPVLWQFVGVWPNNADVYFHATLSYSEAAILIREPKYIRLHGVKMGGPLIPLHPLDGSNETAVYEFNQWASNEQASLPGGRESMWEALASFDADNVESFINKNNQEDN